APAPRPGDRRAEQRSCASRASPLRKVGQGGSRRCAFTVQRPHPPPRQLRARRRMRQVAEAARIQRFMAALGEAANHETRVYLTGGASAVLQGWRLTTLDVDIEI